MAKKHSAIISLMLAFAFLLSSCTNNQENNLSDVQESGSCESQSDLEGEIELSKEFNDLLKLDSLTDDSIYSFSLPGIERRYPDVTGRTLIDKKYNENSYVGVMLKNIEPYKRTTPNFYITLDMRSFCDVKGIYTSFYTGDNNSVPKRIEYYGSDDGYSYTFLGEGSVWSKGGSSVVYGINNIDKSLKMVKAVIFTYMFKTICIEELDVRGTYKERPSILSKDATYVFDDTESATDTEKIVLDGSETKLDKNTKSAALVKAKIDTENMHATQILDLGKVCNITEVCTRLVRSYSIKSEFPDAVDVYVSEDGENYKQYGLAYEYQTFGPRETRLANYRISKPYTTKARYIRLQYINESNTSIDAVTIYGYENEIQQKILQTAQDLVPYNNVALKKPAKVGDNINANLTDGIHGVFDQKDPYWSKFTPKQSPVIIDIDLEKEYQEICGTAIEIRSGKDLEPKIEVEISADGKNFESKGVISYHHTAAGKELYIGEFDKTAAQYIRYKISDFDTDLFVSEIQVYDKIPHEPFLRGGWLAIFVDYGKGSFQLINKYTENDWEKLFYSMRRAGMDYAVLGNIANANTQITLYPNPSVPGYTYFGTNDKAYGSADQIEDLLSAADKAGMKIFVGSIINTSMLFTEKYKKMKPDEQKAWMDKHVSDGNIMFKDISERYGDHESFYGYYLSDETCDAWLHEGNGEGVKAARARYYKQSEWIRKNAPDKKILIAPAIWHTIGYNAPVETFVEDILSMTKDGPMGKPLVDIIAFQDCLGRQEIDNNMYKNYEESLDAITQALLNTDIQVWNDTEVFNHEFTGSKPYNEIIDSLHIGMKNTNCSIVFDIIHYINNQIGDSQQKGIFETDYIMREYMKFYTSYKDMVKTK